MLPSLRAAALCSVLKPAVPKLQPAVLAIDNKVWGRIQALPCRSPRQENLCFKRLPESCLVPQSHAWFWDNAEGSHRSSAGYVGMLPGIRTCNCKWHKDLQRHACLPQVQYHATALHQAIILQCGAKQYLVPARPGEKRKRCQEDWWTAPQGGCPLPMCLTPQSCPSGRGQT